MDTPKELISDLKGLVSLPETCVRVTEMVDDPNCSVDDIGKVLSQDPSLTIRILKIANSPFYGLSKQIETVSRAISVMGTSQLRDLVVATSAARSFEGIPNTLITMEVFWYHSIACGIAARVLAARAMRGKGESLFVAGLLHDIGQLVIFNKRPTESKKILLDALEGPSDGIYHSEMDVLGFTHCDVGAELAREWHLPELYSACIEFHHTPTKATGHLQEVALVHIANIVACMVETEVESATGEDIDADLNAVDAEAWQIAGVSREDIPAVIDEVRSQIPDVMNLILN